MTQPAPAALCVPHRHDAGLARAGPTCVAFSSPRRASLLLPVPRRRVHIVWFSVDAREELGAFDGDALVRGAVLPLVGAAARGRAQATCPRACCGARGRQHTLSALRTCAPRPPAARRAHTLVSCCLTPVLFRFLARPSRHHHACPPPPCLPTVPAQEDQTQFVLLSLRYLARRYNLTAPAPTSRAAGDGEQQRQPGRRRRRRRHPGVVLLGHSMGGVVARAAAQDAASDPLLGEARVWVKAG